MRPLLATLVRDQRASSRQKSDALPVSALLSIAH